MAGRTLVGRVEVIGVFRVGGTWVHGEGDVRPTSSVTGEVHVVRSPESIEDQGTTPVEGPSNVVSREEVGKVEVETQSLERPLPETGDITVYDG